MIDGSYNLLNRYADEITAARLRNLAAGMAIAGRLEGIRLALAYDLTDIPYNAKCTDPRSFARIWRTNMRAWKRVTGVGG